MVAIKASYDCVVVGAGPGGAATASIVAEAGFRTLLIERESVPRFHVGESLMPEVYWPLKRLGMLDKMRASPFQEKKSVQFVSHHGKESEPFFFKQHDPRECSSTWQVERSVFDQMLTERAQEWGAEFFDQTRLLEVLLDGCQRVEAVRVQTKNGRAQTVSCNVVVDATGQQAFIANQFGLKRANPNLSNVAIWGYYENATRDCGENAGATIILQTKSKDSWFWFIPLADGITSVGCVGDRNYLLKRGHTPDQVFQQERARCPGLGNRLRDAHLCSPLRTIKEFSYWTTQPAGDGWVLVGDAFGFIDPVYSSGVYFALEMGVRAGEAVAEGLRRQDFSANQLGSWAAAFLDGSQWIRRLVDVFYTKEFSVGRFLREFPEHRSNLTDLLIGRIFHDQAGKIFDDLQPALDRAKASGRTD